jgi:hypothetical protein
MLGINGHLNITSQWRTASSKIEPVGAAIGPSKVRYLLLTLMFPAFTIIYSWAALHSAIAGLG